MASEVTMESTASAAEHDRGPTYFPGAHNFTVERQYNIGQQHVHMGNMGLLGLLNPVPDASHIRNRTTSPPDSTCLDGTRKAVLKQVTSWIDGATVLKSDSNHILWLYGPVGCGKSAIAQTMAEAYAKKRRLLGSFFFFRGSGQRSRSYRMVMTLASQLAASIPSTAPLIEKAISSHAGLLTTSTLSRQLQYLFLDPFQAALRNPGRWARAIFKGAFLVVLDGLDECEDRQEVAALIEHLLQFFHDNPRAPLLFFISSRVEEHIRTRLNNTQVRLLHLAGHASYDDILFVVNQTFDDAAKHSRVIQAYGEWPKRGDRQLLAEHAGGSFAFMSTILRYVLDSRDDASPPTDRLSDALQLNPGLDALYLHTLARSGSLPHFSRIIWTIALLKEPLSIAQLAQLLQLKMYEVIQVLINLQSIVQVPGDDITPVTLFHTSLRDFLTTEARSGRFFASPDHHYFLTIQSLHLFNASLDEAYVPFSSSAALYARFYWRDHWRLWLNHGAHFSSKPRRHLRLHLRGLLTYFNSMWPEVCRIVLPTWSSVDHSILVELGIDINPLLKLMLKLPQYRLLKSRQQRWKLAASLVNFALATAEDTCESVLSIHDEVPSICRKVHSSFANIASYHATILSLSISRLFPREPRSVKNYWRNSPDGRGKPEWQEDFPADPADKSAIRYLFFALPRRLTEAAKSDPVFTRRFLLSEAPGGMRDRFLIRIPDYRLGGGFGGDFLTGPLAPTAGSWSAAFLERFRSDMAAAKVAVENLLHPQQLAVSSSKHDWTFLEIWDHEHYIYASTKDDCTVLGLWMGYLNIAECFLAQQEEAHDTSTCTIHNQHYEDEHMHPMYIPVWGEPFPQASSTEEHVYEEEVVQEEDAEWVIPSVSAIPRTVDASLRSR